ncbi:alkaline phosphatase-like protein [Xylona heveae TC161]|uniref:GPI ethanolamine phosphate transferase 2 n=1 Tax=Xylona heveae (strain CBS 132557 / TC161) TaxID=1328760 RepID=A0A165FQR9_XYLHT|nr:alkaline phosphatase-like protein [Xylona heveae TC161]KZF21265.1 alkaline phosphatase-like protein [Xylona heveae TC161]
MRVQLSLANVIIPIAILVFAIGFFPYKPFLQGLATFEDDDYGAPPEAPFDKIIFMVVDALRSVKKVLAKVEVCSLISSGAAIPFTAHATSPTITMPRVKAITTGSVPSFLDVILNFAESDTTSTLAHQDTWLAQMKAKGNGIQVMYGDDTWLKLFPDTFGRSDGTTSFFVSIWSQDFTEVDNNVTRHIPDELRNDDWNAMVMHYLGLDHIGHKAGPRSPNMIPKQREMDSIVQTIYEAIETEKHLESVCLVLCGDHGMNDAGNHGGSSPGETSPALVFISPKLRNITEGVLCPVDGSSDDLQYYTTVEQSDVAPTLAGLLGIPVPKNNLGVFIRQFLGFWKAADSIQLLQRNALQLRRIAEATYGTSLDEPSTPISCSTASSDVEELACLWKRASDLTQIQPGSPQSGSEAAIDALLKFCHRAQNMLSGTASNYNLTALSIGIALAAVAAGLAAYACLPLLLNSVTFSIGFSAICLGYGIMMFASSYVEEEQHFWYWTSSAWMAYLFFQRLRCSRGTTASALSALVVLGGLRITRRWNQTGQKYAGEPDIVREISKHNYLLWSAVFLTYLDLMRRLLRRAYQRLPARLRSIMAITLCFAAFMFKLSFTEADAPELLSGIRVDLLSKLHNSSLVTQARSVFLGVGLSILYTALYERSARTMNIKNYTNSAGQVFHDLITLFLITQSRVTNIPLFLVFESQINLLDSLELSPFEITITSLLFQYVSFFAFGGTNAISSVDLSNAYNGVSGYNIVGVGVLTFVSNWTGPIWWMSAGILLLRSHAAARAGRSAAPIQRGGFPGRESEPSDGKKAIWSSHIALLSMFTTISLLSVMVACAALRTHLFIWTVFSPKYLYAMAWSIANHILINILCGSLLFWSN